MATQIEREKDRQREKVNVLKSNFANVELSAKFSHNALYSSK